MTDGRRVHIVRQLMGRRFIEYVQQTVILITTWSTTMLQCTNDHQHCHHANLGLAWAAFCHWYGIWNMELEFFVTLHNPVRLFTNPRQNMNSDELAWDGHFLNRWRCKYGYGKAMAPGGIRPWNSQNFDIDEMTSGTHVIRRRHRVDSSGRDA